MTKINAQRSIVVVEGQNRRRIQLDPADFIGSGAMGDVYRVSRLGYPGACVKLYKKPDKTAIQKVVAMIQRPPPNIKRVDHSTTYVQFAWPDHLVEDVSGNGIGFLMPEVDFKSTFSLVTYTEPRESQRFLTPEQRSLRRRVTIARNICSLMADLHALGHAFVDFKDQNVRIYPAAGMVAFVDNDGFRIEGVGGKVFPGLHTTPTYNSPESVSGQRQQLDLNHDRFVLGILLFRLLNFGIHPFQGVPAPHLISNNAPFDIDHFIAQQLYPYGVRRSQDLRPTQRSIHECWDVKTVAMFEQTFLSKDPTKRITASQWARHFDELDQSGFRKCQNHPNDIEHVHFINRYCPVCGKKTSTPPSPPPAPPTGPVPINTPTPPNSNPASGGLPPPEKNPVTGLKIIWAVVLFVLLLCFNFYINRL